MDLGRVGVTAAWTIAGVVMTALTFGPSVWGLIDVSRYPDAAWTALGRSKNKWTVTFVVGLWAWFVGVPAAIHYNRNVRPRLRAAAPEIATRPVDKRSRRAWIVLGALLATLWSLGFWAYFTHGHDDFFDDRLARRANAVCEEAQAELEGITPAPDGATFEQRAQTVERGIPVFEELQTHLRSLSAPGKNDDYDRWIEHWREYNDVVPRYADALRTGDPELFEPIGNEGDAPMIAINRAARANNMPACVF